ncbi:MAG TPA: hypothetical protein DDY61_05445 [Ruminococcaceae bacterium]|nr:hypothetical protein [Oscillospiraceae bacterium]
MFLDENAARLLVILIIALMLMMFAMVGFAYGLHLECKDLERENRALRQYITSARETGEERHAEYKADFERRMKQNTADPARHERNDI